MSRLCTELDFSVCDGAAVVRLSGEITSANGPRIGELVLERLDGVTQLRVDLAEVDYMSSAGLRLLVLIHRRAEETGAKVTVGGLKPQLRFIMQAVGFMDLFTEAVDQSYTEQSYTEQSYTEQSYGEQSYADQPYAEQSYTEAGRA